MLPFNYHHLYYFFTIAEEGGVTAASKRLRLAPSTLSAQLKEFEDTLGHRLFDRRGKRLFLTETGRQVLSYAKNIFDIGKEMSDFMGDRSRKNRLRLQLGVTHGVPRAFVDELLKFILRSQPEILIELVSGDLDYLIPKLNDHHLDGLISEEDWRGASAQGNRVQRLAQIPVIFCAHPRYLKKVKRVISDADHWELILPETKSYIYRTLMAYMEDKGLRPKVVAQIQDIELIRRLVLHGKGIAPMNVLSAKSAPAKERLVLFPLPKALDLHSDVFFISKQRLHPHLMVAEILSGFKSRKY